MDEIKVEIIPPIMLQIVARQTDMDPVYIKKVADMMGRDELVLFGARRQVENFTDSYIGRVSLWLAQPEEPEVWRYARDAALIMALYVNERARSQGVAKYLMNAAEDEARARGRRALAVGVEPSNASARHLYESLGFQYRKCGENETYKASWDELGDGGQTKHVEVDAYLMVKQL